jgi:hypothetical protein
VATLVALERVGVASLKEDFLLRLLDVSAFLLWIVTLPFRRAKHKASRSFHD